MRQAWRLDEDKFFNREQTHRLITVAREHKSAALRKGQSVPVKDWFLIELCMMTGLRVKEIADLKHADIVFGAGTGHARVRNGKGGKARKVKMPDHFRNVFESFIEWKRRSGEAVSPDAPLFASSRSGGHMSVRALQKSFKRSLKRADLPEHYSVHCLRHTYATRLYAASDHNLRLVQSQLGHSSINTTQIYVGLVEENIHQALNRLRL